MKKQFNQQTANEKYNTSNLTERLELMNYIDDNFSKTRNMFLKRKKTYEKLGYEIVEKNEYANLNA